MTRFDPSNAPPTHSERRTRPRIPVCIELELHAPAVHVVMLSRTIDLSSQGAFIRSSRTLPLGVVVSVAFRRGEHRNPLVLDGRVVRNGTPEEGRSSGVAVQFEGLTPLDEVLVRDLITTSASSS